MKDFKNKQFTDTLCYALADSYEHAKHTQSKEPYSMVLSLSARYAEAYKEGAIFYGPIAVIPKPNSAYWTIRDLRGGWGYDPLNIDLLVNGDEPPTLEAVIQCIRERAESLRRAADFHESTANFLEENKPI